MNLSKKIKNWFRPSSWALVAENNNLAANWFNAKMH
jgi:hypothetical protein